MKRGFNYTVCKGDCPSCLTVCLMTWLASQFDYFWVHRHRVSYSGYFVSPFLTFSLIDLFSFTHPFALPCRWLYGKTVCYIYAFCGMLFGLCSLTTLTLLSMVCFVKVCYPIYGKSSRKLCILIDMTQPSLAWKAGSWLSLKETNNPSVEHCKLALFDEWQVNGVMINEYYLWCWLMQCNLDLLFHLKKLISSFSLKKRSLCWTLNYNL